jgi:hypothetical protein
MIMIEPSAPATASRGPFGEAVKSLIDEWISEPTTIGWIRDFGLRLMLSRFHTRKNPSS